MLRTLALVSLATALGACADVPAPTQLAPAPTLLALAPSRAATTDADQIVIVTDRISPVPANCTGETVQWHIEDRITYRETIDANGGLHIQYMLLTNGSGVGTLTGAKYELRAAGNQVGSEAADGLPSSFSATLNRRFISQGSLPNFRVNLRYHFTLTPDGTLASYIESAERVCD